MSQRTNLNPKLIVLILASLCGVTLIWFLTAGYRDTINDIGVSVTITGFIIGVIAFWWTYVSLDVTLESAKQAKIAAESASRSVDAALSQIKIMDIAIELARMSEQIKSIPEAVRSGNTLKALAAAEFLRITSVKLDSFGGLDIYNDENVRIEEMAGFFGGVERAIESGEELDFDILRIYQNFIIKIEVKNRGGHR